MRKLCGIVLSTVLVMSIGTFTTPTATADEALTLVDERQLSERVLDLTFETDALDAPTPVRVLLPDGYDPSGATRYPVIYLLHGGAASYVAWTDIGAAQLTAGLPVIVVMPDAGRSAWYTDWYNNGAGGNPRWETYHVGQLVPWIDDHFPTVGDRSGRAVAGLSSGGFGALSYAARHPDVFVAAAGFSAAADTNTPPVISGKVIDGLAAQDRGGPGSLFGIREVEEVRWRGKNPWDLADNLRQTDVTLRAGNGMAGGDFGGGGPTDPVGFFLEKATYDMSVSMHQRLVDLGIDHTWDDYGAGTHSNPYWRRSLERTLPTFMAIFAEQRPDPASFAYRAIEADYDVYDWRVSLDRPVVEFSELDVESPNRFAVSGSGTATVLTPPTFDPGSDYIIDIDGEQTVLTAGDGGRLRIDIPLGPGNPVQQQFTPDHRSPLTTVHTATISIAAT
jgi:S-formylglutathione hydrolase FrmB